MPQNVLATQPLQSVRPQAHVFPSGQLGLKEAFDGVQQNQQSLRLHPDEAQRMKMMAIF